MVDRRTILAGLGASAAALAPWATQTSRPRETTESRGSGLTLAQVDEYPSSDEYDSSRLQNAVDDAVARGLGGVSLGARTYEINVPVDIPPVRGFLIQGSEGVTILQRTAPGRTETAFRIAGQQQDVHENIRFDGLTFLGGMKNIDELGTRRARGSTDLSSNSDGDALVTWNDGVLSMAISAFADRTPLWTTSGDADNNHGVVRNVSVTNCSFVGMQGLPVHLRGVRGYAALTECYLRRSLDPGFVFCENVQFSGNLSEYSMDNGASISRGCERAVAVGNTIIGAWFSGIHIGGFVSRASVRATPAAAAGPHLAAVSANVIEACGEYGIRASLSTGRLSITGNTIIDSSPTSKSGRWSRSQGVGVLVSGWSARDRPRAVTITGNTIDGAARGGIICRNAEVATISGNTVQAVGTGTFPDGKVRSGPPGTQAFGISHGSDDESMAQSSVLLVTGNAISPAVDAPSGWRAIFFPPGGKQLIEANLSAR